jgi:hypothetical protein
MHVLPQLADRGRVVWLMDPGAESVLLTVRQDTPLASCSCLLLAVFVSSTLAAGGGGLRHLAVGLYVFVAAAALMEWLIGNSPWRLALPVFAIGGLTARWWVPLIATNEPASVVRMQVICGGLVIILLIAAFVRIFIRRGIVRSRWQLAILERELRCRVALPFGTPAGSSSKRTSRPFRRSTR